MKVLCTNNQCGWHGDFGEALVAAHPFIEGETVTGCPKCKDIEVVRIACEEGGCWLEATCGTQTKEGYKRTCYKHRPTT